MGGRRTNVVSFRIHKAIDIDFMAQVARRISCERVEAVTTSDLAREKFEELVEDMKLKYPEDAKKVYGEVQEPEPEEEPCDQGFLDK